MVFESPSDLEERTKTDAAPDSRRVDERGGLQEVLVILDRHQAAHGADDEVAVGEAEPRLEASGRSEPFEVRAMANGQDPLAREPDGGRHPVGQARGDRQGLVNARSPKETCQQKHHPRVVALAFPQHVHRHV